MVVMVSLRLAGSIWVDGNSNGDGGRALGASFSTDINEIISLSHPLGPATVPLEAISKRSRCHKNREASARRGFEWDVEVSACLQRAAKKFVTSFVDLLSAGPGKAFIAMVSG